MDNNCTYEKKCLKPFRVSNYGLKVGREMTGDKWREKAFVWGATTYST